MNSSPRKEGLDFKIQNPTQLLYEKIPTHLLRTSILNQMKVLDVGILDGVAKQKMVNGRQI